MKRVLILILSFFVNKTVLCQKYDSILKPPAILNPASIFNSPPAKEPKPRRDISDFWNYEKEIGQAFGEFSAKDITGKSISRENLVGKITLVNFSFSTCPPCIPEYDKLNRLYAHYLADTNFQLISFTFDNIDEARRTSEKYGLLYRIISITHDLCSKLIFSGHGYPSNYLLDENCRVTFGHPGAGPPGTNTDPFREIIMPQIDSLLLKLKNSKKLL